MTTAMAAAKERQLDWLLGEVLGDESPLGETPFAEQRVASRASGATLRSRWFAAALVVAAVGTAFGVALLRDEATEATDPRPAQEPRQDVEWTEAHGPASLAAIPAGVVNLRCFDFDDAACAQLARFTQLERLDLSGSDVNDQGYAIPPQTTDKGVRELGALKNLRWLCLARCEAMKGDGLQALEALPRLEHLDLTYSGVRTPAIERLPRLPSLRSLVLSHNLHFHGSALAAVANIPGLRRLELQGCPTLAAKDVLPLVKLKELRHLDLRDCQGRFRGQTLQFDPPDAEDEPESGDPTPEAPAAGQDPEKLKKLLQEAMERRRANVQAERGDPQREAPAAPAQPVQDGAISPPILESLDRLASGQTQPVQDDIGITDDVVIALSALPLETLLLGGSESLTDAIGDPLAKMTTLRELDLSNLPKTTGALLAALPTQLTSLNLDHNQRYRAADLARLAEVHGLRELGLAGLPQLDDATLRRVLKGKHLTTLHLGGCTASDAGARGTPLPTDLALTAASIDSIAAQKDLERLALDRNTTWLDAAGIARIAALPKLRQLDFTLARHVGDAEVAQLTASRSLQVLNLSWCTRVTGATLASLAPVPLRELRLFGTKCDPPRVRELAAQHWHGCAVVQANGNRFVAP